MWYRQGDGLTYNGHTADLDLLIMKGVGPSLLGRNWFKPFGITLTGIVGDNPVMTNPVGTNPVFALAAQANQYPPTHGCYTQCSNKVAVQYHVTFCSLLKERKSVSETL